MASIEPFIHRKIIVLHTDATVKQAAHAMREKRVGSVLVSDHVGHLVGIVTDRDIALGFLRVYYDSETPLSEIMSSDPVSVDESADTEKIVQLMERHGIRRIPVIRPLPGGAAGTLQKCIGIVTLDDLIASRMIDEYHLIRVVRSQVLRRIWQYRKPGSKLHVTDRFGDRFRNAPEDLAEAQGLTSKMSQKFSERGLRVPDEEVPQAVEKVIGGIVRRLHHSGAMHLILELSGAYQEKMLGILSGPEKSLTVARMKSELSAELKWEDDFAQSVLEAVCDGLEELIDFEALGHVKAQLPDDWRALFYGGAEARRVG